MLRRFAAGSLVASVVVAFAALALLSLTGGSVQRFSPMLAVWCFAPFVWGLWAMITPQGWVPQRLPMWGGVLGVIAGVFAVGVLNMPERIFGTPISVMVKSAGVIVLVVFYYCMWMLVSLAYNRLSVEKPATAPKVMKTAA